jgi:hypothetical protein
LTEAETVPDWGRALGVGCAGQFLLGDRIAVQRRLGHRLVPVGRPVREPDWLEFQRGLGGRRGRTRRHRRGGDALVDFVGLEQQRVVVVVLAGVQFEALRNQRLGNRERVAAPDVARDGLVWHLVPRDGHQRQARHVALVAESPDDGRSLRRSAMAAWSSTATANPPFSLRTSTSRSLSPVVPIGF